MRSRRSCASSLFSTLFGAVTWLVRVLAPPTPRRSSKALWGKKQHKQQPQTSSLPGCHLSRLLVPAAELLPQKAVGVFTAPRAVPRFGLPRAAASSFRLRGPSSQGLRGGNKAGGERACPAGTRPTELERLSLKRALLRRRAESIRRTETEPSDLLKNGRCSEAATPGPRPPPRAPPASPRTRHTETRAGVGPGAQPGAVPPV